MISLALLCALGLSLSPVQADEAADLAAARALFERNVAAIQAKDRDAYLACYRHEAGLVRVTPSWMQTGFEELASETPQQGSDAWPERLVARDLQVSWIRPGVVYGTYRYHAVFHGVPRDGISGRLFVHDPDGWHVAVTSAFDADARPAPPPLALVGATLHDGSGGPALEDSVVLLRGGMIVAVGKRGEVTVPDGVDVVDLSGKHLTPGLIDTHVHYSQTGWADGRPDAVDVRADYPYAEAMTANRLHPERFHLAFLKAGVTAVFDVGGYPWTRTMGAATEHSTVAPHVVCAGPLLATWVPDVLNLPDQQQLLLMQDEAGVREMVRTHEAEGSQAIKVWFVQRGDRSFEDNAALVRIAGDEAKKQGLPLIVHATELATARVALEAGARLLVHSVGDVPVDDAFLEAAKAGGIFYCPTLTVREGYWMLYARQLSDEVKGELDYVDPTVRARVLATESLPADPRFSEEALARMKANMQHGFETMAANLVRVHEAGIPIVLGTDAGNPLTLHGPSVFHELEAMEKAGLAPADVLVAATRDAARAIGRGDDLGLVAPGRVADLLVLDEDPTASTHAYRSLREVVRGGLLHEREDLHP